MTIWDKGQSVDSRVLAFSAGDEYKLDQKLVPYDCLASIAHAKMLHKIGILSKAEAHRLEQGLREIQRLHGEKRFPIRLPPNH